MTPLRLAVAVSDETSSFGLRVLLERLCHTVILELAPAALLKDAQAAGVDLIVVDQGSVGFSELLARVAGLREVSVLPLLVIASKAEPGLVDQLLEWPGTGLIYAPADVRGLYLGIASSVAAAERERRYHNEVAGLRAMVGAMQGATIRTGARGEVQAISADACALLGGGPPEQRLGMRIEELLGIPEPLAILALRGREHELESSGQGLRVSVADLGADDDGVDGWLVTLRVEPSLRVEPAQAAASEIKMISLASELPAGPTVPPFASVMPRDYQPHFRSLSLSVLARDVASQATTATQSRSLRIQVEPNMRAVADEVLLRELLELLLRVARSATYGLPNGQIRLGQRVTGERAVFYVFDNGRGDDPSRREFLSDRLSDTGYGRVERIVGLHGGVCGYKLDDVGRGATVFFTLPKRQREPEVQRSSTSSMA